jgi:hypothetical protein
MPGLFDDGANGMSAPLKSISLQHLVESVSGAAECRFELRQGNVIAIFWQALISPGCNDTACAVRQLHAKRIGDNAILTLGSIPGIDLANHRGCPDNIVSDEQYGHGDNDKAGGDTIESDPQAILPDHRR